MEQVALCICGCGNQADRGQWVRGHWNRGKKHVDRLPPNTKPKRIKKTHEEMSQIAKERWDKRGRVTIELHACACGCGEQVKGKWAQGHHSRVNNISKREEIRKF